MRAPEKYLAKNELVPGSYYKGHCRNASVALWMRNHFVYLRTKLGNTFAEIIFHPEDDDGFDLFYPTERIT